MSESISNIPSSIAVVLQDRAIAAGEKTPVGGVSSDGRYLSPTAPNQKPVRAPSLSLQEFASQATSAGKSDEAEEMDADGASLHPVRLVKGSYRQPGEGGSGGNGEQGGQDGSESGRGDTAAETGEPEGAKHAARDAQPIGKSTVNAQELQDRTEGERKAHVDSGYRSRRLRGRADLPVGLSIVDAPEWEGRSKQTRQAHAVKRAELVQRCGAGAVSADEAASLVKLAMSLVLTAVELVSQGQSSSRLLTDTMTLVQSQLSRAELSLPVDPSVLRDQMVSAAPGSSTFRANDLAALTFVALLNAQRSSPALNPRVFSHSNCTAPVGIFSAARA